jgi:hypothetical protein
MRRETGVSIALENVWNDFLMSPLEAAAFVDACNHPKVGWYFDVGNVLRYGRPTDWIEALDKRILKIDIKEFSLEKMNSQGSMEGLRCRDWVMATATGQPSTAPCRLSAIQAGLLPKCQAATASDWPRSRNASIVSLRRDRSIAMPRDHFVSSASNLRALARPVSQPNKVGSLPSYSSDTKPS